MATLLKPHFSRKRKYLHHVFSLSLFSSLLANLLEEPLLPVNCDSNTMGRFQRYIVGQEVRARMDENQHALRHSVPALEYMIHHLERHRNAA